MTIKTHTNLKDWLTQKLRTSGNKQLRKSNIFQIFFKFGKVITLKQSTNPGSVITAQGVRNDTRKFVKHIHWVK